MLRGVGGGGGATLGANTFTGLQTITQATVNTGILASTGYSLTGSDATSMVNFTGTWNTSGNPVLIKYAITNTASGSTAKFVSLLAGAAGATEVFSIAKDGSLGGVSGALAVGGPGVNTTGRIHVGDPSGNSYARIDAGLSGGTKGAIVASDGFLGFTNSAGNSFNTVDAVLARVGAGIIKITDTSTGAGVITTQAVAVASLPSAATAGKGARAMVTDSSVTTFNTTVAAGGANNVPVFSDGTNWKVG